MLAWEEAADYYERTLQLEALCLEKDELRRGALNLDLAQTLWRGGDYAKATEIFHSVIAIARQLDHEVLFGRAVLGLGGWPQFRADEPPGGRADEYRVLLEEASERLGDEPALQSSLFDQLAQQNSMEARKRHNQQAVALARASGDSDALFAALGARTNALLGPDDVRCRLEVSTEMLDLAMRSGSKEKMFVARESRIRSFLALGEIRSADREIEVCSGLTDALRAPAYRHSLARFRFARALADGRLDEAAQFSNIIHESAPKIDDQSDLLIFNLMNSWLQHQRGNPRLTPNLIEDLVAQTSLIGQISFAVGAFFYAELDLQTDSQRNFDLLVAGDLHDIPKDEAWLMTVALASDACVYLDDSRHAEEFYTLLLPYTDLIVSHQHLRIYLWPVERTLARLAECTKNFDTAAAHYESALNSSRRTRSCPYHARTQYEFGRMLLDRVNNSSNRDRRADLLIAEAAHTAKRLGLQNLLDLMGLFR